MNQQRVTAASDFFNKIDPKRHFATAVRKDHSITSSARSDHR
jgi:hypothetical protein